MVRAVVFGFEMKGFWASGGRGFGGLDGKGLGGGWMRVWLRNRVQALASARCEVMRSCFILHCVAENSGDLRFLARSRQISPRAVLGTIGLARNRLPATGVEIGITWITDRPQAGRRPVSWACELEDRPALDLGNLLRERR